MVSAGEGLDGGIYVLDKTDETKNLDWKSFISVNQENMILREVIDIITQLESEPSVALVEKALSITKETTLGKDETSFCVLLLKLQEITNQMNPEELNWWDSFFINRGTDSNLRKILIELENAEKDEESESLSMAILLTSKLDNTLYDNDINTINKRVRMLQKRITRRVSNNLGSILLSLREQKGLSLSKLGDLAGVSASYINRLELNERKAPSYPIIEKLAQALEVNVNTLLVAAGAHVDTTEVKSFRELFFSNNVSILGTEHPLSPKKKEELIRIIDFIAKMEWKDNKHIESLQLFELISQFKAK